MSFTPTAEQHEAIAAAKTGGNLVIEAGAGSGKTSTLKLVSDALAPKRGLYVAYNKAIQVDASKSFPSNVTCKTSHALAFATHGRIYIDRIKNGGRVTARMVADRLGIDRSLPLGDDRELGETTIARLAGDTVRRFCQSGDDTIQTKHAPFVPGAEEVSHDLALTLVKYAETIWANLQDPDARGFRFEHDHYLKMWSLSQPTLKYDFIFIDEAQDSNPCVMAVMLRQNAQLIAVGDRAQAIYGWRGAKDAMASFPAKQRTKLSQSFRFGPAVADVANVLLRMLDNTDMQITGNPSLPSVIGAADTPDAILCRTNAGVIQAALDTPAGQTFAIVGGTDQIKKFAEAAADLMAGRRASWHPDLGAFKSWAAVCEYADEDGDGADLKVLVNLCRDYGPEELQRIAQLSVPEDRADRIISTAHKAKGREWDSVRIAGDFTPSDERQANGLSQEECMLAYVAVTRAKLHLDPTGLAWALDGGA